MNMLKNYFSNKYRACKYMTRLQYSVLSSLLCMWYWHACQCIYKKNTYDNMHCRCLISFKNLILQFKNFAYNCENIKLWMPNFNPTICLVYINSAMCFLRFYGGINSLGLLGIYCVCMITCIWNTCTWIELFHHPFYFIYWLWGYYLLGAIFIIISLLFVYLISTCC